MPISTFYNNNIVPGVRWVVQNSAFQFAGRVITRLFENRGGNFIFPSLAMAEAVLKHVRGPFWQEKQGVGKFLSEAGFVNDVFTAVKFGEIFRASINKLAAEEEAKSVAGQFYWRFMAIVFVIRSSSHVVKLVYRFFSGPSSLLKTFSYLGLVADGVAYTTEAYYALLDLKNKVAVLSGGETVDKWETSKAMLLLIVFSAGGIETALKFGETYLGSKHPTSLAKATLCASLLKSSVWLIYAAVFNQK